MQPDEIDELEDRIQRARGLAYKIAKLEDACRKLPKVAEMTVMLEPCTGAAISVRMRGGSTMEAVCFAAQFPHIPEKIAQAVSAVINGEICKLRADLAKV